MRHEKSLTEGYFEEMFRGNPDPWGFETSPYEKAKYARTIAALEGRHFASGLEVGCANGALTAQLAPSFDRLLALDVSATAVAIAAERCKALPQLLVRQMAFPETAPDPAGIDCVILSEVIYYWDDGDLARAARWLASLASGACLLLVHYILETDYPQSGDIAVAKLQAYLGEKIHQDHAERHARYRLDRWSIA